MAILLAGQDPLEQGTGIRVRSVLVGDVVSFSALFRDDCVARMSDKIRHNNLSSPRVPCGERSPVWATLVRWRKTSHTSYHALFSLEDSG